MQRLKPPNCCLSSNKRILRRTGCRRGPADVGIPASVHVSAWEGDRLVGFARALTDGVYIGLVVDVVVDASVRGQGIGRALIGAISRELKDVEGIHLGCEDELVGFYQKLGCSKIIVPS